MHLRLDYSPLKLINTMESNINWIMLVLVFLLGGIILGMVYVINVWRAQQMAPVYESHMPQRPVLVSGDVPRSSVSELMIFIIGILMIGGVILKPHLDNMTGGKPNQEKGTSIEKQEEAPKEEVSKQDLKPRPIQRGSIAGIAPSQEQKEIAGFIPEVEYGVHYVQVAAYTHEAAALKSRKAWFGVGSQATTILQTPEGNYKVLIGPFPNKRKARVFIENYVPNGFVILIA